MEESKLHYCHVCKEIAKSKCSACKVVWYCSPECQKGDWKAHKPLCNVDEFLHAQSRDKKLKFENFELIRDIGEGNFS